MKYRDPNIVKGFWLVRAVLTRPFFKKMGRNCYIGRPVIISGKKHISIGDNVHIYPGMRLEAVGTIDGITPEITIGNNVGIAQGAYIYCSEKVEIGDNVALGPYCMINDSSHGYGKSDRSVDKQELQVAPIKIGDNSWIGFGAVILPGVTIGKHCVIGANSVVTHDLEDNTIVRPGKQQVVKMPDRWFK